MRTYIVESGPNKGHGIHIDQEYLYRGTNINAFLEQVKENKNFYFSKNDNKYGISTLVALNIDGASSFCSPNLHHLPNNGKVVAIYDEDFYYIGDEGKITRYGNRPILLAIRHEKYQLKTPKGVEGLAIDGLISLDNILLLKTERDLLKAAPFFNSLEEKLQRKIRSRAGIFI